MASARSAVVVSLSGLGSGLASSAASAGPEDDLRRAVAAYEAGKVLVAYCTPEYEDVARVSVCPHNTSAGYTLFVDDDGIERVTYAWRIAT